MIDSLKQLQRLRVIKSVAHTAMIHFYLALFLSCVGYSLKGFLFGLGVFCICVIFSTFYHKYIFEKHVNSFWDAACFLDEELNTQAMYITISEYGDDSQNLMLQLLHIRGFEQAKEYLDQDFESNQKQLVQKKMRQCAIVLGLLLLLLLLFKVYRYFGEGQLSKPNTFTENAASKKTGKGGNSSKSIDNRASQDTNKRGKPNSQSDNRKSDISKSGGSDSKQSDQKGKGAQDKKKENGGANDSPQKTNKTNSVDSPEKHSSKSPPGSSYDKGVGDGVDSKKAHAENSKVELNKVKKSKGASEKINESNKSNSSDISRESEKLNQTSKSPKDISPSKSSSKDTYDAKLRGNFLGDGKFENLDISDQRDIENTEYKKRQDALQQVLNNPNLPKSYKDMLKRIYGAEKK